MSMPMIILLFISNILAFNNVNGAPKLGGLQFEPLTYEAYGSESTEEDDIPETTQEPKQRTDSSIKTFLEKIIPKPPATVEVKFPEQFRRALSQYGFDESRCVLAKDRVLCDYNPMPVVLAEEVVIKNGCKERDGRIECGYEKPPYPDPFTDVKAEYDVKAENAKAEDLVITKPKEIYTKKNSKYVINGSNVEVGDNGDISITRSSPEKLVYKEKTPDGICIQVTTNCTIQTLFLNESTTKTDLTSVFNAVTKAPIDTSKVILNVNTQPPSQISTTMNSKFIENSTISESITNTTKKWNCVENNNRVVCYE